MGSFIRTGRAWRRVGAGLPTPAQALSPSPIVRGQDRQAMRSYLEPQVRAAPRRGLERRAGQDAPWRIRVRSAVRLLRREGCTPAQALSPAPLFAESRSPGDAKLPRTASMGGPSPGLGTPRRTGCAVAHQRPERGASAHSTRNTVHDRAPCAPMTRDCSMSAVFEGPETKQPYPGRGRRTFS